MNKIDPLNHMCQALVSIHHILRERKPTTGDTTTTNNMVNPCQTFDESSTNKATNREILSPHLQQSVSNHPMSQHLHTELLTNDNFHRAHICSRKIDELPSMIMF
jgi:hypothetical protein